MASPATPTPSPKKAGSTPGKHAGKSPAKKRAGHGHGSGSGNGNFLSGLRGMASGAPKQSPSRAAGADADATQGPGLELVSLDGLKVNKHGKLMDDDEGGEGEGDAQAIGELVDGDVGDCAGKKCNDKGEVLDEDGKVIGHVKTLRKTGEEAGGGVVEDVQETAGDKGPEVGGEEGGKVGEGVGKERREGVGKDRREGVGKERREGFGKEEGEGIGQEEGEGDGREGVEALPEEGGEGLGERAGEDVGKEEGEGSPFAKFQGRLIVTKDGYVEDENGNRVGKVVDGDDWKKLVSCVVDENGDILDKKGSIVGHAERYDQDEEPEPGPAEREPAAEEESQSQDLSILDGRTVNKQGNVIGPEGVPVGRLVEGHPKHLAGRKIDGKGQIWSNSGGGGKVIGRVELVPEEERDEKEGPFWGFTGLKVFKDGKVRDVDGNVVGIVTSGDTKRLAGRAVDEDGDVVDKFGNVKGHVEPYDEPEEPEEPDQVPPESEEAISEPAETEKDKARREDEDGLADKMSSICEGTLREVQPVLKQIAEHIDMAGRTPREERNEEELVDKVKPLIEESSRILGECKGALRGLDLDDGRTATQAAAKGRAATREEATPKEDRLADLLKELTSSLVTAIDNAKKRIADMPHAKKKLNPLWALLTEPLFQILAAVGSRMNGVLNRVGQLLNGLGLGRIVNGLLGGLGINKLLGELDREGSRKP